MKGYGQSDSVTISLYVANKIEKDLSDYRLLKISHQYIIEAEAEQQTKINSLLGTVKMQVLNLEDQRQQIAILEQQLWKKENWSFFWKAAVPTAFVAGLLINQLIPGD